ncbi:hypothetical protein C442_20911 [Haloarcula amylolytica JCM 13557]|uniref:Uncharacterized protein n=1 Tax=Haloarcula amylolytica JCM 13557 TaxID=1227452 RepID=M0K0G4_9EURY|nr:hypothetical protein C442_20911 [Haloarcula amylolytica JCM 13557]
MSDSSRNKSIEVTLCTQVVLLNKSIGVRLFDVAIGVRFFSSCIRIYDRIDKNEDTKPYETDTSPLHDLSADSFRLSFCRQGYF